MDSEDDSHFQVVHGLTFGEKFKPGTFEVVNQRVDWNVWLILPPKKPKDGLKKKMQTSVMFGKQEQ